MTPTANPRVRIEEIAVLSDKWYTLRKVSFDYQGSNGTWTRQHREAYDRGNGAVALLLDPVRRTVVLTRQFRMPAYLNGHPDGMLIEAPAGLLDGDDPSTAIRREVEEETGYRVDDFRQLFDVYMSPGSVTERVVFFAGSYDASARISEGGGHAGEGEDLEVIELGLDRAEEMILAGEIRDGKTIMLVQWALLNEARLARASAPSRADTTDGSIPRAAG